jgi:hypothetical protein
MLFISFILIISILFIWRFLRTKGFLTRKREIGSQNVALIVLGSGGHTMEMFRLMNSVCERFSKRVYVTADELSKQKVTTFHVFINHIY